MSLARSALKDAVRKCSPSCTGRTTDRAGRSTQESIALDCRRAAPGAMWFPDTIGLHHVVSWRLSRNPLFLVIIEIVVDGPEIVRRALQVCHHQHRRVHRVILIVVLMHT